MPSPFPGMNPYLVAIRHDFHERFLTTRIRLSMPTTPSGLARSCHARIRTTRAA
jgi:hypothetical protein